MKSLAYDYSRILEMLERLHSLHIQVSQGANDTLTNLVALLRADQGLERKPRNQSVLGRIVRYVISNPYFLTIKIIYRLFSEEELQL